MHLVRYTLMISAIGLVCFLSLAGCQTISRYECQNTDWSKRGYSDGASGHSKQELEKYADACSKYGIDIDDKAWKKGYEDGFVEYCNYDNGYIRGAAGSTIGVMCGTPNNIDFMTGVADGKRDADRAYHHEILKRQLERAEQMKRDTQDKK